ncbi:MAG TPA: hypothetical protein VN844_10965 [Pyrinomonadaceae bacterium]|nr:hypothetical protein [Pyrinomonadaceae bacterium]
MKKEQEPPENPPVRLADPSESGKPVNQKQPPPTDPPDGGGGTGGSNTTHSDV